MLREFYTEGFVNQFQLAEPGKEFQTYSKNHFKRTAAQAKVLDAAPQERYFTLH